MRHSKATRAAVTAGVYGTGPMTAAEGTPTGLMRSKKPPTLSNPVPGFGVQPIGLGAYLNLSIRNGQQSYNPI